MSAHSQFPRFGHGVVHRIELLDAKACIERRNAKQARIISALMWVGICVLFAWMALAIFA